MTLEPFVGFRKLPRLSRECIITEKIDGTNAQVFIDDDGELTAGSRTRWLVPGRPDNYGFAAWCEVNKDELLRLGPGHHFGEWWGAGIQRHYGLTEKRFSLFNVSRWADPEVRPRCCDVVPTLYCGPFTTGDVEATLAVLRDFGSLAAPGFMQPEGVVVFHVAAGIGFKKTLERDEQPKGRALE